MMASRNLLQNNIQLATNEPLHLIEKYQKNICSIICFFLKQMEVLYLQQKVMKI